MATYRRAGVRSRWASVLLFGLAVLFISPSTTWADKYVRVGQLWDIYSDIGHEGWGGIAMVWPGGFWKEDLGNNYRKDCVAYKAYLLGTKDWQRPADDANWKALGAALDDVPAAAGGALPYYVVQRDTRYSGAEGYQLMRGSVNIYYKSDPAVITTDGEVNPVAQESDGENPLQVADAKLVSSWGSNMGITTTRTVYAFIHPDHDDYHIWHYNFKNTGIYCCPPQLVATGTAGATHNLEVPNVMFSHSIPYMDRSEGGIYTASCCEWNGDALQTTEGTATRTRIRGKT